MTVRPTIRRYWREAALLIVILVPWLALLPLGFLWLWQNSAAIWWFLGAALLSVAAFALRLSIGKTAKDEAEAMAKRASPASLAWGLREKEAWRLVEQIGRETEPLSFTETEPIKRVLERTVDAVAEHFHPGASRARLRISLPEGLLLAERLSRGLRRAVLTNVPGARDMRLSDAAWAKTIYDTYGTTAKRIYASGDRARRLVRFIANPKGALLGEATMLLVGQVGGFLSRRVRAELTSLLIRETGRATIDLYSGRLRLADDEIQTDARAENRAAKVDLTGPVRIVLAGQVNAGKSSLLNAMAKQVQRTVGVTPTRDGPAELTLKLEGRPEVVLVDTLGIGSEPTVLKSLADQTKRADLILWVVSATQSARAPDVQALKEMRNTHGTDANLRMPPILVVVTHIDELTPALEWAPPYNLVLADHPKAGRIRDAIEHVGNVLDIGHDRIVPVCVRDVDAAYNLDLLWNLVVTNLDAARFAKLDRLRQNAQGLSAALFLSQLAAGGRWLAKAGWRGGS
jgi:predicted GTPase